MKNLLKPLIHVIFIIVISGIQISKQTNQNGYYDYIFKAYHVSSVKYTGKSSKSHNGLALLDVLKYAAPENPEHFESVDTQEELTKMMAYFFQHGAAAE
jgi:hypothetical protein